jgi:hypothetical protein
MFLNVVNDFIEESHALVSSVMYDVMLMTSFVDDS